MKSILEGIEGVRKVDIQVIDSTVTVHFDKTKTSVQAMRETLASKGYQIQGAPLYIK